jgi:hypothetical protein
MPLPELALYTRPVMPTPPEGGGGGGGGAGGMGEHPLRVSKICTFAHEVGERFASAVVHNPASETVNDDELCDTAAVSGTAASPIKTMSMRIVRLPHRA